MSEELKIPDELRADYDLWIARGNHATVPVSYALKLFRYIARVEAERHDYKVLWHMAETLGIAKDASGAYYNKRLVDYQNGHAESLARETARADELIAALEEVLLYIDCSIPRGSACFNQAVEALREMRRG